MIESWVSVLILSFNTSLSISSTAKPGTEGVGVEAGGVDGWECDIEESPFKNLIKFSLVSITSPFLLVILSPTILYLLRKLVSDRTDSACGSESPNSNAFVFRFKYSSLAIS